MRAGSANPAPATCPPRAGRPEQRGSLFGRFCAAGAGGGRRGEESRSRTGTSSAPREPSRPPARERAQPREAPRDPRHVRAVPTTADVKVERALELFNGSEHARSIAGIMRSLGEPWVAAAPDIAAPEPGRHPDRVGAFVVPLPRRSRRRGRGRGAAGQGRGARPARGRSARLERPGVPGWQAGPRCRLTAVIYCVVPQALADELYDKLVDYYKDDPNVKVIVDRRAGVDRRARQQRRRRASSERFATAGGRPDRLRAGRRTRPVVAHPKVVVHVDGGSRGNPGPAAAAAVATAPDGTALGERALFLGDADEQRRRVQGDPARDRAGSRARRVRDRAGERLAARRTPDRRRVQGEEQGPDAALHRDDGGPSRIRPLERPRRPARAERARGPARQRGARPPGGRRTACGAGGR